MASTTKPEKHINIIANHQQKEETDGTDQIIMSVDCDDLSNEWGVRLLGGSDEHCRGGYGNHATRGVHDVTLDNRKEDNFNELLQEACCQRNDQEGVLQFCSQSASGSTANAAAISELTWAGERGCCAFAAGVYGSGIRDFHHAMSMSHGVSESSGNINQLFCLPPFDTSRYDSDSEALRHKRMDLAAFLPYRINPDADNHCFREYEDKCLFDFEAKVCMSKAKGGRAIVALLIEPILAGCGASMSTRALSILGAICQKHSICVIVDEILTAGRCFDDCLLYTCKRFPKILYDQVSHITMGKWFGCGIVLAKKYIQHTPHVEDWKIDTISARGSSTLMNLSQPMQRLKRWTDLSKKGNMDLCRETLVSLHKKKNHKCNLPPMEE